MCIRDSSAPLIGILSWLGAVIMINLSKKFSYSGLRKAMISSEYGIKRDRTVDPPGRIRDQESATGLITVTFSINSRTFVQVIFCFTLSVYRDEIYHHFWNCKVFSEKKLRYPDWRWCGFPDFNQPSDGIYNDFMKLPHVFKHCGFCGCFREHSPAFRSLWNV